MSIAFPPQAFYEDTLVLIKLCIMQETLNRFCGGLQMTSIVKSISAWWLYKGGIAIEISGEN